MLTEELLAELKDRVKTIALVADRIEDVARHETAPPDLRERLTGVVANLRKEGKEAATVLRSWKARLRVG